MKDFKTIEELVQLLESRGVITDEWTPLAIERESYYAIVNGYKGPFLDKQAMTSTHEDVYLPGTRFEWIYYLFMFDRDLRAITFRYLAQAEAIIKSAVVYSFCKKNQGVEDYKNRRLYAPSKNLKIPSGFNGTKAEYRKKNLDRLMSIFRRKTGPKSEKEFIRHYVDRHGYVPLWVLSNDLTFGNILRFYQLQKRGVQNATCKMILEATGKDYPPNLLTPDVLNRVFTILVDFRNLCAHDDRLYCARVGKGRQADYRDLLFSLMIVLPETVFDRLQQDIADLFDVYEGYLHVVTPETLLKDMGLRPEPPNTKTV